MKWDIIGSIASAVSLIIGVATYIIDKYQDKRHRTLDKISELFEDYHNNVAGKSINEHYREHVRFLSELDRFCKAVIVGYYSPKDTQQNASRFLVSVFNQYKDTIIQQRRKQFREDYYSSLEKLADRLK